MSLRLRVTGAGTLDGGHDPDFGRVYYYAGPEFHQRETTAEKLVRKVKADPLVPIGAMLTAGCLVLGIRTMSRRVPGESQKFMRARVVLQGTSILHIQIPQW